MKLIEENPLPKKSRPSIDIPDKEIWTVDDFRQALEDMPSSLLHLGIHFAYASSCRPGEMLALTETCIDLAKEGSNSRLILTQLKTPQSIRDIFLPEPLLEEIKLTMFRNKVNRGHYGEHYQDHNPLFAQDCGHPVSMELLSGWLEDFIKGSAYEYPRVPFRNIRTASLTEKLTLSEGDVKAVQGDSGHSSAKTLVDWYAQIQETNRRALMDKCKNFFYGAKEQFQEAQIKSESPEAYISTVLEDPDLRKAVVSALFAELAAGAGK